MTKQRWLFVDPYVVFKDTSHFQFFLIVVFRNALQGTLVLFITLLLILSLLQQWFPWCSLVVYTSVFRLVTVIVLNYIFEGQQELFFFYSLVYNFEYFALILAYPLFFWSILQLLTYPSDFFLTPFLGVWHRQKYFFFSPLTYKLLPKSFRFVI